MSEPDGSTTCSDGPGNGCTPGISLSEIQDTKTVAAEQPYTEEDGYGHEVPPVGEIERDLDALTYSGSTINDLEIQLTRSKQSYQQTLSESKRKVDALRRKLNTHIQKSEPFIEIWRKARQTQEESNKAAMKYDKASSQHAASKEMIRVAEAQLSSRLKEGVVPSSPSPLDLAWQEMLNHATIKVVETEKERRASELEHRAILEQVTRVMEEYRSTERKLRTHIVKSRVYYEERFSANQRLHQMKQHMQNLETKINESKKTYTDTLKKLEVLNTEIHHRRANSQTLNSRQVNDVIKLDPRRSSSTGCSPQLGRGFKGDVSDTESLDSVQVPGGFTGSTGSLPSIGTSSVSDCSPTPEDLPDSRLLSPLVTNTHSASSSDGEDSGNTNNGANPIINSEQTNGDVSLINDDKVDSTEEQLATKLVRQCLSAAVHHLEQTT